MTFQMTGLRTGSKSVRQNPSGTLEDDRFRVIWIGLYILFFHQYGSSATLSGQVVPVAAAIGQLVDAAERDACGRALFFRAIA